MSGHCIVGAGLAGLIAAHAWPTARVLESASEPRAGHRALLRFRTDAVARLTGIEFARVRVHKGLWAEGAYRAPDIRWANLYARKVLRNGVLRGDRSVWSLEPVDRWVAPDTFYEQLVEAVGARVLWNTPADFAGLRTAAVSTAPLPVTLAALGIAAPVDFVRAPIAVARWRLAGVEAYQTAYFPEPHLSVYRASITGSTLIVESVRELDAADYEAIIRAFGLDDVSFGAPMESTVQQYGKIAPIDDPVRKQLLFRLTHEHGVFSLGRFATWRNILLDDVVEDIAVVKRLMRTGAAYDARRAAS